MLLHPITPQEALAELADFIPVAYRALDAGCQGAAAFFRTQSKRRRTRFDPDLHPHLVRYFAKLEFKRHRIKAKDRTFIFHNLRLNGLQAKRGRFNIRILKECGGTLPPAGTKKRRDFYQQPLDFGGGGGDEQQGRIRPWNLVLLWHLTKTRALDHLSLVCPKTASGSLDADRYWEVDLDHPALTVVPHAAISEDVDREDLLITLAPGVAPALAPTERKDLPIDYGISTNIKTVVKE
jgi:hypothetical protein